jgi:hypothetical protein
MFIIQHYFIWHPSHSTVLEDAGIKTRTVATTALTVRRSNHSARSHLQTRHKNFTIVFDRQLRVGNNSRPLSDYRSD